MNGRLMNYSGTAFEASVTFLLLLLLLLVLLSLLSLLLLRLLRLLRLSRVLLCVQGSYSSSTLVVGFLAGVVQ